MGGSRAIGDRLQVVDLATTVGRESHLSVATLSTPDPRLLHRPLGSGQTYWGPGDMYRFLVTGEETGGAYFAMEALVPPGGGPPPHIHANEDETFYVLEGEVTIRLGDTTVTAGVG